MANSLKGVVGWNIRTFYVWYTLFSRKCITWNSINSDHFPNPLRTLSFVNVYNFYLTNIKNEKENTVIDSTDIIKIRGYFEQLSLIILKRDETGKFLARRNLSKQIQEETEDLNNHVSIK